MTILGRPTFYLTVGAVACILGCATSGGELPQGSGGLTSTGGSAALSCTSPDCACPDCMSACLCSSDLDQNACASACGVGNPGGTGNTGGVGGLGTGGFGTGGSGTGGFSTGGFGTGGDGVGGTGGDIGTGGIGGAGGDVGTGGVGGTGTGTCCPSGDCLCHGPAPTALTSRNGTFRTATFTVSTGTVHYPTDAEPPFAGVAVCGGFLNTGPEMADWGTFYASHGIVTIITTTTGADFPDIRATKLLAAVTQLKAENTRSGSPLMGKLSDRFGTSGYSMGGGGTTIASGREPSLKSSVGLASWSPTGNGIQVPTLLLCGSSDTTAPCSGSTSAYNAIPTSTPKMMVTISGASHLNWFGPTNAGGGVSGETALAFQKVFLEGDERWKPLLLQTRGTKTTNIQ